MVVGDATVLSDPAPSFGGLRAVVRIGGRRLEAHADGPAADALADALAGEVVRLRGEVEPLASDESWLEARHVSGRLTVLVVESVRPGHPVTRVANGLRRTLVAGATPLDGRQRSLLLGLVLGDDRGQPPDLADAFRGAGLTHLLAVSGENVAFVLALAGPLLRRLRLWSRLGGTLAVIGLFAVMTRFEPSVLRASAMAALACVVAMAGHPVPRIRIIAVAVTALLVVDPLLVRSVGFQLSVGAAVAIVVLAPSVAAALPGPAALRDALAVTISAQLGVAPVLLASFGPVPVASLPANLLAVPVAGLVMVWGLTGGMVAGLVGGPAAVVLHGPTRIALGWLELVASRSAGASLGELGPAHVIAAAVGTGLGVLGRARRDLRRIGWALAAGSVTAAVLAAHAPAPLRSAPMAGVVRWHGDGIDVVVLGGAGGRSTLAAAPVLGALRRSGVRGIDVLVVADATVPDGVVAAVREVHPAGALVAHRSASFDGALAEASRPPPGLTAIDLGGLSVRFLDVGDRLVVDAVPRAP
jgi:competence protein ComEC